MDPYCTEPLSVQRWEGDIVASLFVWDPLRHRSPVALGGHQLGPEVYRRRPITMLLGFICPRGSECSAVHGTILLKNSSQDRKSTRLNSSHHRISYAVFCLKKTRLPLDFARPRYCQRFAALFRPVTQCTYRSQPAREMCGTL